MINSKASNITLAIIASVFLGCASSTYKISKHDGSAIEITVTPERVILECEHLDRDDGIISDGFTIHVLTEEKKVLTLAQGNAIDPESCSKRLKTIGKILQSGRLIYLAGIGSMNATKEDIKQIYRFPGLGSYHDSGISLSFAAIANEHGACFSAYGAEEKPCPRSPFPLK